MSDLILDVRYALRSLLRRPGFTAVAVLTLALGIGANTALFSAIHTFLLTPPPFPEADELVVIPEIVDGHDMPVAVPNYLDVKREARSFEQLGAYSSTSYNLSGGERAERASAVLASIDVFDVLGVELALGPGFPAEAAWERVAAAAERADAATGAEGAEPGGDAGAAVATAPAAPPVVVLGRGLWERRFASDVDIIGRTVRLDDQPFTVVGVLRQDFELPWMDVADVWVPLATARDRFANRGNHSNTLMLGRLAPGVTREAAQQEVSAVYRRLEEQYPETNTGFAIEVQSLTDRTVRDVRPAMLVLWGAVGFVLLIACANLANLTLTRATGRFRELAVRRALGAGRGRLLRQLLTESVVVGVAGGVAGVLLAAWGIEVLRSALGESPQAQSMGLDVPVLLFALGLAVVAGLGIGVVPALLASRQPAVAGLSEGGRGGGADRGGRRLRQVLVAAEIAMALVLLIGAGLMIESFWKLRNVDPGFQTDGLLVAEVLLPRTSYDTAVRRLDFYGSVLQRLAAHPEVEGVTLGSPLPLTNSTSASSFEVEGTTYGPGEQPSYRYSYVAPGYHELMEVPLLAGRTLRDSDGDLAPAVMLVDRLTAEELWPGVPAEEVVGRRMRRNGDEDWTTVVGVVAPIHHLDLDRPPQPHVYFPLGQHPPSVANLVVATRGEPLDLAAVVRDEVARLDPNLALGEIVSMEENRSGNLEEYWYPMLLLGSFAVLALALAALGIYGVMAYGVAQRTREIGVRMALGSARRQVLGMVLGEGLAVSAAGAAVGLAGGLALAQVMGSLLYEVKPGDPLSLLAVTAVLVVVAVAACLLPARRAASIDPIEALRWE